MMKILGSFLYLLYRKFGGEIPNSKSNAYITRFTREMKLLCKGEALVANGGLLDNEEGIELLDLLDQDYDYLRDEFCAIRDRAGDTYEKATLKDFDGLDLWQGRIETNIKQFKRARACTGIERESGFGP